MPFVSHSRVSLIVFTIPWTVLSEHNSVSLGVPDWFKKGTEIYWWYKLSIFSSCDLNIQWTWTIWTNMKIHARIGPVISEAMSFDWIGDNEKHTIVYPIRANKGLVIIIQHIRANKGLVIKTQHIRANKGLVIKTQHIYQ